MNKENRNNNKLQIRNSTAEFLVFTKQNGEDGIEVRVQNGTVWLTQKAMAALFDVQIPAVSKHLKNIFQAGELDEKVVISILETTTEHGAIEWKIQTQQTQFYNLDAIISNSTTEESSVVAVFAKQHAENEFEKYRPIQDRLFESDFDRVMKMIENEKE
jgi:hypothetical protein